MNEITTRIVIVTERNDGRRKPKIVRLSEREPTREQQMLWDEICDNKTNDDALRASMINAALSTKREWMRTMLSKADIEEDAIAGIMSRMAERASGIVRSVAEAKGEASHE